jgi:hypothetical protein
VKKKNVNYWMKVWKNVEYNANYKIFAEMLKTEKNLKRPKVYHEWMYKRKSLIKLYQNHISCLMVKMQFFLCLSLW